MAIKNKFSAILGEQRIKQTDVARESGLSYQTVNDFYHGKHKAVSLSTLDALCRVLGVGVGDLLVYVPEDEEESPQ